MGFEGWVWPIPAYGQAFPTVSDPFDREGRGGRGHLGADIMYKRSRRGDFFRPEITPWFAMPSDIIHVLCAGPGTVFSINELDSHGVRVTIDHGNVPNVGPRVTVYRHLKRVFVSKGDEVVGGTPLGICGGDPTNGDKMINHLHFELWDTSRPATEGKGRESFAIDPGPVLATLPFVEQDDSGEFEFPPSEPGFRLGAPTRSKLLESIESPAVRFEQPDFESGTSGATFGADLVTPGGAI